MKKMLVIASVILSSTIAFAQSSSTSAATSASSGTIAAPATIIEPIKNPSKWSTSLYYGAYSDLNKANYGEVEDNYAADAFVQVRRDIGNGQKLALRVNAMRNQTDRTQTDEWDLFDPQFLYSFPVFASTLRLSLPVSDWSQDIGRYELRYNGGHDMFQSGKFTVSSLVEARAYAYTEEEDGQRAWRGRLGASAIYEINKYVSPYVAALYQADGNYHGTGLTLDGRMSDKKERVDSTLLDLGAEINIIPKVL
ncbi:MAG: hypothetical protein AABZ31_09205, partial [Bdellovibrionota bacterium]